MLIRERIESNEEQLLCSFAVRSRASKGRVHPIAPCEIRTEFMRDRDRIIHCKSFRRMKYKTQVFLQPTGDHYRTRLTHTLEVAQIARTIARALRLNEDLTEAIALGHDLGHTPFGHVGEMVLNEMMPGGFEHNCQSLRMIDVLENGGNGLNLTFEVRDGILNHKKSCTPCTLEGMVVNYSDRIAYINHDIDDALRAGVLCEQDLPQACIAVLGKTHGLRINNMIQDIVHNSYERPYVRMSEAFEGATDALRAYMFKNVYTDPIAKGEESKARALVCKLYEYYHKRPEQMSEEFTKRIDADGIDQTAADWIACMTDRFAVRKFSELFVPHAWDK